MKNQCPKTNTRKECLIKSNKVLLTFHEYFICLPVPKTSRNYHLNGDHEFRLYLTYDYTPGFEFFKKDCFSSKILKYSSKLDYKILCRSDHAPGELVSRFPGLSDCLKILPDRDPYLIIYVDKFIPRENVIDFNKLPFFIKHLESE